MINVFFKPLGTSFFDISRLEFIFSCGRKPGAFYVLEHTS